MVTSVKKSRIKINLISQQSIDLQIIFMLKTRQNMLLWLILCGFVNFWQGDEAVQSFDARNWTSISCNIEKIRLALRSPRNCLWDVPRRCDKRRQHFCQESLSLATCRHREKLCRRKLCFRHCRDLRGLHFPAAIDRWCGLTICRL